MVNLEKGDVENYLSHIQAKHNLNVNNCCTKRKSSDEIVTERGKLHEKSVQTTIQLGGKNRLIGRRNSLNVRYISLTGER